MMSDYEVTIDDEQSYDFTVVFNGPADSKLQFGFNFY